MRDSNFGLDAVIIADSGLDSLSGTNPLKLKIDGKIADIQTILNFVKNNGQLVQPIEDDNIMSWASAPKLNGIYLYSYLMQNGFNAALINNYTHEKNKFVDLLKKKPSAIIISTPFIFLKKALSQLIKDIRILAPKIYIIAGGSYVYYSYLLTQRAHEPDYETDAAKEDFLFLDVNKEPPVDLYIISPRGEDILCKALHNINLNQSNKSLPNSAYLEDGKYHFSKRIEDSTELSFPQIDWSSLPDSIFQTGVVPLQASNGCPYNCTFCNFTKDRKYSFIKPIDILISEIKTVQNKGVKYIWFVDDNFRLGRNDLDDVCRRFIEENIQVKWMCFIRASTLKNADIPLLRRASCVEVQIGLESGDPEILKNMNKQVEPSVYRNVIKELLKNNINVSCYFISGFPGETEESSQRTREFIKAIEHPEYPGILSWSLYPFILSPLSPIYEPEMRKNMDFMGTSINGFMTRWIIKKLRIN